MYTASDFLQAASNNINNYPTIAALYNAGDPLTTQNIGAIAAMLGLLSAQIDAAQAEPFDKARNATVLADAAIRGIIPKARSGQIGVVITNNSGTPYTISTNRIITDTVGNQYMVKAPVTVIAGGFSIFTATQVYTQQYNFTVSNSVPFYPIQIPASTDSSYLAGVDVYDNLLGIYYRYANEYININAGDYIFHIESDDKQNVYVRFGDTALVGYQPTNGTVITLTIYWSIGVISPTTNSPFAFQYIQTPQESSIVMTLNNVIDPGANPMDIATLRDFTRYPSVYDTDAVFLGEFDFLVRRYYPDCQFLSVWNETIEEAARGPNLASINTLFVAFLSANGGEATISEPLLTTAVTVQFSGGTGTSIVVPTATPIIYNGVIIGIQILTNGSGYSTAPTATITGGNGSGATLGACVLTSGGVSSIPVTFGGSGYGPIITTFLTAPQLAINQLISNADDSYKIVQYTPVISLIFMTITATVSTSYVSTQVLAQIINLILSNYGSGTPAAAHANQTLLNQQVYQLLINNITALSDGQADFTISITPYPGVYRPELWRYVDPTSLTVNVSLSNTSITGWRG